MSSSHANGSIVLTALVTAII